MYLLNRFGGGDGGLFAGASLNLAVALFPPRLPLYRTPLHFDTFFHGWIPSLNPAASYVSLSVSNISRFGGGNGGLFAGVSPIWLCVVSEGFNIDSFVVAEQGDQDTPTPAPSLPQDEGTPAPVGLGETPAPMGRDVTPAPMARDVTPAPVASPGGGGAYGGVPAVVPGVIEAEEFDNGGEGVGYSDFDPGNNGGVSFFQRISLSLSTDLFVCITFWWTNHRLWRLFFVLYYTRAVLVQTFISRWLAVFPPIILPHPRMPSPAGFPHCTTGVPIG